MMCMCLEMKESTGDDVTLKLAQEKEEQDFQ